MHYIIIKFLLDIIKYRYNKCIILYFNLSILYINILLRPKNKLLISSIYN